jgi:hypothetical protein
MALLAQAAPATVQKSTRIHFRRVGTKSISDAINAARDNSRRCRPGAGKPFDPERNSDIPPDVQALLIDRDVRRTVHGDDDLGTDKLRYTGAG